MLYVFPQVRMTDTYYAALLAKNPETQAGILYLPSHFSYHQNKLVLLWINFFNNLFI